MLATEYRAARFLINIDKLAQCRSLRMVDNIVAEQDGERLIPHECLRTENGIAEATHVTLPDIMHFDIRRLLHEM